MCTGTEHETVAVTPTSDRDCAVNRVCNTTTEYETSPPDATTDRVCASLRVCSPTEHETVTLANNDKVAAITIGDNMLARLVTPGHTNDSISLLLAHKISDTLATIDIQYAFVGDGRGWWRCS